MVASIKDIRVLVLDDIEPMRLLVRRILTDLGVEQVHLSSSGPDALASFETFSPDLIITDLQLGEMDGISFLKKLRAMDDPKAKNMPVIVLSGYSEKETIEQALKLGVKDFLAKPIAPKTLEERVRRLCLNEIRAA